MVVGREGIEPPQPKAAGLQPAELTTCSTYPLWRRRRIETAVSWWIRPPMVHVAGADDGTRTRNRRFTKPLLYQLSYVGATGRAIPQMTHRRRGMIGPAARWVKRRATRRRRRRRADGLSRSGRSAGLRPRDSGRPRRAGGRPAGLGRDRRGLRGPGAAGPSGAAGVGSVGGARATRRRRLWRRRRVRRRWLRASGGGRLPSVRRRARFRRDRPPRRRACRRRARRSLGSGSTARVGASSSGATAASVALGDRLEQQDRARDGGVERADRAPHRDPHEQVAAPAHGRPEALALAADDDRQRAAQVASGGRSAAHRPRRRRSRRPRRAGRASAPAGRRPGTAGDARSRRPRP